MAVPKRRSSKQRRRTRRGTLKITAVKRMECPHCHEQKLPHRVCLNCGYYNGRKVIDVKVAE